MICGLTLVLVGRETTRPDLISAHRPCQTTLDLNLLLNLLLLNILWSIKLENEV